MKKTNWVVSAVLITLLTFTLLPAVVNADPGWTYRRPITITNNSGSALTNYQVLFTLTTATMGNPYTNVNSDGSDLRFTNADNTVQYDYWIESWDRTGTSRIWVEVASVPTGGSTMYMWYGYASASSASNGSATFLLFDDFNDGAIAGQWTQDNSGSPNEISESARSGYVRLKTTGTNVKWWTGEYSIPAIRAACPLSDNFEIVTKMDVNPAPTYYEQGGIGIRDSTNADSGFKFSRIYAGVHRIWPQSIGTSHADTSESAVENIYLAIRKLTYWYVYYKKPGIDWTPVASWTQSISNMNVLLYEATEHTGTLYADFDWIFVRKYVSLGDDPTTSVGSQQSTGGVDPVPELPTIILLGTGLTVLFAYFVLRRFRQVKGRAGLAA